ncbi:MAG TPA: alpha/beta hydrolase [Dehalococcoidales bacterium]|nr:alpha/beta hydrolase [Dehalococcoidales bacterium]
MPYVNNNGVKIHYEVEGRGPPLMLVHGMGGSIDSWRVLGYTQELSKDHRLILIDIRGFGASDKPRDSSAYEFETRVSDLLAVLDDLKIDKAAYFGYSMGGKIGFRIPIYAPQRFSHLILGGMGYPITGKEEWEDPIGKQRELDLQNAIREAPDNPMEFVAAAQEKRTGTPIPPALRAITLANDARAFLVYIRKSRSIISPKAEEVLPKIKIPCLLFAGELDPWFPIAKECAARIPGAKFVSFPGLDHPQTFGRNDLVLPIVRKFLAEVKDR